MRQSTICFLRRSSQLALAVKKRGFGAGHLNGYGGKVKPGETPEAAAVRELAEESGVHISEAALIPMGYVHFYIGGEHIFQCFLFIADAWEGEPIETDEMRPEWVERDTVPFDRMWAADRLWIPLTLAGTRIEGEILYAADKTTVESFTWHEAA